MRAPLGVWLWCPPSYPLLPHPNTTQNPSSTSPRDDSLGPTCCPSSCVRLSVWPVCGLCRSVDELVLLAHPAKPPGLDHTLPLEPKLAGCTSAGLRGTTLRLRRIAHLLLGQRDPARVCREWGREQAEERGRPGRRLGKGRIRLRALLREYTESRIAILSEPHSTSEG